MTDKWVDPLGDTSEAASEAQNGASPDTISMPVELVQRIVDYLATQPYAHVFQLIAEIQQVARRD